MCHILIHVSPIATNSGFFKNDFDLQKKKKKRKNWNVESKEYSIHTYPNIIHKLTWKSKLKYYKKKRTEKITKKKKEGRKYKKKLCFFKLCLKPLVTYCGYQGNNSSIDST